MEVTTVAGIIFYSHKELGKLLKAPGIARILGMYTIAMPSQAMAFAAETNYMLISLDVFDKEVKLSAGIYDLNKEALAKAKAIFGAEDLVKVVEKAKLISQAVTTPLGP